MLVHVFRALGEHSTTYQPSVARNEVQNRVCLFTLITCFRQHVLVHSCCAFGGALPLRRWGYAPKLRKLTFRVGCVCFQHSKRHLVHKARCRCCCCYHGHRPTVALVPQFFSSG